MHRRAKGPGSGSLLAILTIALLCVTVPAHAISCLVFPLSCLKSKKKYGDEEEGTVLKISSVLEDHYVIAPGGVRSHAIENKKFTYVSFVVGRTHYVAEDVDTILTMAAIPKPAEFIGHPVKLRFMDEKWMGIDGAGVLLKRPNGKEWKLTLISIIGPGGIDECAGRMLCPPQAKVDREAREAQVAAAPAPAAAGTPAAALAASPVAPAAPEAAPAASEVTTPALPPVPAAETPPAS